MSKKWRDTASGGGRPALQRGVVVKADTSKNPQRRERGLRRQRLELPSTGAPTGADGAAGQRDAGNTGGAANSAAQNKKPEMMPKYTWTGVLYWCAGGVRRAVVRNRAAMPEALVGVLSVGS